MKKSIISCVVVTGIFLSAYFLMPQFALSGGDEGVKLAEIKKRIWSCSGAGRYIRRR